MKGVTCVCLYDIYFCLILSHFLSCHFHTSIIPYLTPLPSLSTYYFPLFLLFLFFFRRMRLSWAFLKFRQFFLPSHIWSSRMSSVLEPIKYMPNYLAAVLKRQGPVPDQHHLPSTEMWKAWSLPQHPTHALMGQRNSFLFWTFSAFALISQQTQGHICMHKLHHLTADKAMKVHKKPSRDNLDMRKKMRDNHFASNFCVCFLPSVHGR